MLEFRLLGQFDLQKANESIEIPSRPAKILLAYLLLTRGTPHPRERLAGMLWPESNESQARKNLRQALWHLRKALGDPYLQVDKRSIAFDLTSDYWLDIALLEDTRDQDLQAEVSIYKGELLPGFYEDWILLERDRLEAAYERKVHLLLTQLVQEEQWMEVLHWAEQWIAQGKVPEPAYRALMLAHAAQGELPKVETAYRRCVEALQREIGVEPAEETSKLHQRLMSGEAVSPYPESGIFRESLAAAAQQGNLPSQPTPFIGRKQELDDIEQLLSSTRLLTLTGPGGIGKTRLALKTAARVVQDFKHGRFFVSLAPIRSGEDIVQTIAEAIRYPLATHEDPQRQLLRHLQAKQLLLVLDNLEHLLEDMGIIHEILTAVPLVKILATSREKLNLKSETTFNVQGMAFPDQISSIEALQFDAIDLFLQTARKVHPRFNPSRDELGHILRICQIVDGMPLAIELAAAWLHVLNVREIVTELEQGIDILATEMRDTPERHRSIRAVFDHSWSLLAPHEQETFLLLSIFYGGFTRQAAQQVTGASLQQLAGLVNKSLVHHDPSSDRFEIHDLLRQYAQEQLLMTPEIIDSARERHAAYFATFMQQKGELLRGKRQKLALTEIEADIDNVRAAWRYYLNRSNASQMWKFISGIWHLYWIRWWNHAGMELFAETVSVFQGVEDEEAIALQALAKAYQGYFMAWLGLAEDGYELANESVKTLTLHDRPEALVFAYDSLSVNAYFLGRMTEEAKAIREMLKIAHELGDRWLVAFTLFAAGMISLIEGDYAEAMRFAESNLELYEEIEDISGTTMPLIVMGHAALARGEHEKAKKYYQRCLKIARDVGFYYSIQTATNIWLRSHYRWERIQRPKRIYASASP